MKRELFLKSAVALFATPLIFKEYKPYLGSNRKIIKKVPLLRSEPMKIIMRDELLQFSAFITIVPVGTYPEFSIRPGTILNAIKGMHMPNCIELKGQGILRGTYKELDKNVYVGNSENNNAFSFYHASDSRGLLKNANGKYLILPDMRGKVVI